jgi:hypothetical protein
MSILYIYNMFELLLMLWIGIWMLAKILGD